MCWRILFLFLCLLAFFSCVDKVDERDIYTFTALTADDYISSNKDLSMYAKLLRKSRNSSKSATTVSSLIHSRGNFTVFAPTNEAITLYLDSLYGKQNYDIDTLPEGVCNAIVLNSIMDLKNKNAFRYSDLYTGGLVEETLNNHHLMVEFGSFGDGSICRLNKTSRVLVSDIKVTNGYVNIVDRVIPPAPNSLSALIGETGNLKIFSYLLTLTTWADSVIKFEDKTYTREEPFNIPWLWYPTCRLYGYTAFVEPDEVFHREWGVPLPQKGENGDVTNWNEIMRIISQKCREVYGNKESGDYTNSQNAVNQFVAYHLIDFKRSLHNLVSRYQVIGYNYYCKNIKRDPHSPINVWNYYLTLGNHNRLLKVTQTVRDGVTHLNRHSYYDNSFKGTYQETSCDIEGATVSETNDGWENYCINGYYYPIDRMLVYDDAVKYTVLNERIRYNIVQIAPEMLSMEHVPSPGQWATKFLMPKNYIEKIKFRETCEATFILRNHLSGPHTENENEYEGISFKNDDDITFPLLPVPYSGNWEVRLPIVTNSKSTPGSDPTMTLSFRHHRVYFGTDPSRPSQFKPLEFPLISPDPYFSEEVDKAYYEFNKEDSMLCFEVMKTLRAHNIVKEPYMFGEPARLDFYWNGELLRTETVWQPKKWLRFVVYRGYMDADKTYYLRLQPLESHTYYSLNRLELCPENIYNNPDRAEDIW